MTPQQKLLAIATKEIGVKESPTGSNKVKYNTWFYGREVSGSSYPWCCTFVCWCYAQAGMTHLVRMTGGCTTMMNWFRDRGYLIEPKKAQPGDLVFYQFDKDAYADHIGIVEKVTKTGVVAIEGNTSVTSQDNGGAVMRRTRKWSLIMAVARPDYKSVEEEDEVVESTIKELVEQLSKRITTLESALKLTVYTQVSQLPIWVQPAVLRLMEANIIQGDDKGLLHLTDQDLPVISMIDKLAQKMKGDN